MKKFLKLCRHDNRGFTLIEILVVVAILGALVAIAIPNVAQFIGRGESEADATDQDNIQSAVLALLADAGVHELDGDYTDIQEESEVEGVTAGTAPNNHSLDEYLVGEPYPLRQAYDIDKSGLVTVHT